MRRVGTYQYCEADGTSLPPEPSRLISSAALHCEHQFDVHQCLPQTACIPRIEKLLI